jgi:SAM-dependent methyltransferase
MRDYSRFDGFLDSLVCDVYPEAPSEPHLSITSRVIDEFVADGILRPGMKVLDIGCGQGLALERFREAGLDAVGLTLGGDFDICRDKGFEVRQMDQNFMEFSASSFDFLWCRHVLEHSVAPLFTLTEYRRVTKPGGRIYVEVPAPDTAAHHEVNSNHYSVLPLSAWLSLIGRVGLTVERCVSLEFTVPVGPDLYWSILLRTPEA